MTGWLTSLEALLDQGEAVIAVTVAVLKGSGPREPGARMLVSDGGQIGSIGGGELEWQATATAQGMLAQGAGGQVVAQALGPELGQCCGGHVTLAFEPFAPSDLAWVRRLLTASKEPDGAGRILRISANGAVSRGIVPAPDRDFSASVQNRSLTLTETVASGRQPLWIFGAGHVGQALVQALAPLPFDVTWIDSRLDAFPDPPAPAVKQLTLAMPELAVEEAPADAMYLVMTHSHQLDEEICAAVLARGEFAYLGLIGSAAKHARFHSRLKARGFGHGLLDGLSGPIGLQGLGGKDPAIIAASVAADLLLRQSASRAEIQRKNKAKSTNV